MQLDVFTSFEHSDLATDRRESGGAGGKTERDFRCLIFHFAIGQAHFVVCVRRRHCRRVSVKKIYL